MIVQREFSYREGATRLSGLAAWDDRIEGPRPAVLVAHMWGGRAAICDARAVDLARQGYVGFALDLYGAGVVGRSAEENAALMQPFIDDRSRIERRMRAAVAAVRSLPVTAAPRVAAEGYCFGGLCVLDLARCSDDVVGVVSYHGLLPPPAEQRDDPLRARVLVLHGARDPLVDAADVAALRAECDRRRAELSFVSFSRAAHGFTNPAAADPERGIVYHPASARLARAWGDAFLADLFAGH